jgi:hypothetical protein
MSTITVGAVLGRRTARSRTETDMAKTAAMKETTKKKPTVSRGAGTKKKKPTGPVLLAGNRALSVPQSAAAAGPIGVGAVLTAADGSNYMVTAVEPTGFVVFGRCNKGPAPDPDPLGDAAEVLKGDGTDDGTDDGTESSYYHAHLERIGDDPLPELTGDDILSCLPGV